MKAMAQRFYTWHNESLIYGPPTDGERIALRPLLPTRGSETSPSFIKNCAKTFILPRKSTIQLCVRHPSARVSCRVFIPLSVRVHRQKTNVDILAHAQYNIIKFCRSVARVVNMLSSSIHANANQYNNE